MKITEAWPHMKFGKAIRRATMPEGVHIVRDEARPDVRLFKNMPMIPIYGETNDTVSINGALVAGDFTTPWVSDAADFAAEDWEVIDPEDPNWTLPE